MHFIIPDASGSMNNDRKRNIPILRLGTVRACYAGVAPPMHQLPADIG